MKEGTSRHIYYLSKYTDTVSAEFCAAKLKLFGLYIDAYTVSV